MGVLEELSEDETKWKNKPLQSLGVSCFHFSKIKFWVSRFYLIHMSHTDLLVTMRATNSYEAHGDTASQPPFSYPNLQVTKKAASHPPMSPNDTSRELGTCGEKKGEKKNAGPFLPRWIRRSPPLLLHFPHKTLILARPRRLQFLMFSPSSA